MAEDCELNDRLVAHGLMIVIEVLLRLQRPLQHSWYGLPLLTVEAKSPDIWDPPEHRSLKCSRLLKCPLDRGTAAILQTLQFSVDKRAESSMENGSASADHANLNARMTNLNWA